MTRCIHCTRCVRFATEIAGVEMLGATGRGEDMEIGNYVERAMDSELSGNVIDLCPVGALTSKPYAFSARPWELRKTETIDAHDAVGSNVRVDARGREIMRVLPRLHEDVNEEWISDKTRFAADGLTRQRLDRPFVRRNGRLESASWAEAFAAIADRMSGVAGDKIAAIAGDLADAESMLALKELMGALGSPNLDCRQDGAKLDATKRASYLFNTTIAGIDDADACLLVGSNPRYEASLVNARLRKRYLRGGFQVAAIGPDMDLTYRHENLGAGPQTLAELADGKHTFANTLSEAQRPMLVLGQGAIARDDGAAVVATARRLADAVGMIADDWCGFNVLHTAAARVAGLDLGLVPEPGGRDVAGIISGAAAGDIEVVYLLGADEIDTRGLGDAFVVYQGHHGDAGAHRADVVLPGAAYTEKDGTYVNTEGRAQQSKRAVFPPGDAREDWAILRALSEKLGKPLAYDTLAALRRHMIEFTPTLGRLDQITTSDWAEFGADGALDSTPFELPVSDFFMTNPICRASETMAACSAAFSDTARGAAGTDG